MIILRPLPNDIATFIFRVYVQKASEQQVVELKLVQKIKVKLTGCVLAMHKFYII